MSDDIIIEYRSKDCKDNKHNKCAGKWTGLGIQVVCNCPCYHNKKEGSLGRFGTAGQTPLSQQSALNRMIDC
jgi:hypothetical protein